MTFGEENIGNLSPLCSSRIDSSRIVSAGVQEEDGLRWSGTKEGEIRIESETDRDGIVVRVIDRRTTDIRKDCLVIRYRRYPFVISFLKA